MVNHLVNRWKDKVKQPSLVSKIRNIGQPSGNLKQQISLVTQRLDIQIETLENALNRFENRENDIFKRIVKALSERDGARANILATELSEIRKVEKMLTHASIAIESFSMRLITVSEVGDLVTILGPSVNILKTVRCEMSTILPEASQELGNIGNLLSDVFATTGQSTEMSVNIGIRTTSEAEKILEEAELAAEKRLEGQLPEVTTGNAVVKRTRIESCT